MERLDNYFINSQVSLFSAFISVATVVVVCRLLDFWYRRRQLIERLVP